MNSRVLAALFTAAALAPLHGESTPPQVAGYHLQNRSAFSSPETTRPPFWPVGWSKQAGNSQTAIVSQPVAVGPLDAEQFSVTSILLGSPSLAVINGKAYGVGEYLRPSRAKKGDEGKAAPPPIPAGARVRVQRITDGGVILQAANQVLTVPLRRPTLSEHKPDDELPSVTDR